MDINEMKSVICDAHLISNDESLNPMRYIIKSGSQEIIIRRYYHQPKIRVSWTKNENEVTPIYQTTYLISPEAEDIISLTNFRKDELEYPFDTCE